MLQTCPLILLSGGMEDPFLQEHFGSETFRHVPPGICWLSQQRLKDCITLRDLIYYRY